MREEFMRFPSVAFCTLTVLLAGGLTAHASDRITAGDSPQEPVLSEASIATPSVTSKGTEGTAKLDKGEANESIIQPAAINSKKEFSWEASASAQNTQAAVKGQVETLGYTPEGEALKSDNNLTTLSTPDVKQSGADRTPNEKSSLVAQREKGTVISNAEALRQDETAVQSSTPKTSPMVADAKPDARANCIAMANSGSDRIGLGDARKSVGAELSYTFETTNDSFGEGGFNAKLHRQLGQDLAGAIGWNGFLNIGRNDFEQSKYG